MPSGKYLTDFEKGQITAYNREGKPRLEIAQLINISKTVVTNFLNKKEKYGIKRPTKGNSKLTNRDKRRIFRLASNELVTSTDIKNSLNLSVTTRTIRNHLSKSPNYNFSKLKKKPGYECRERGKNFSTFDHIFELLMTSG
jgi:transposase